MSESMQDWAGLVERVRSGDRSAEAELVSIFQTRVHCMVLARTRNPETARELTQEAMLHTLHALRGGQLRQADSLPAFIHGVTRNLIAGHRRTTGRAVIEGIPNGDSGVWIAPDHGRDERLEIVRRALSHLSRPDREILLMILVDGMTPSDIAARLRLPVDVIRQRKSRAIKRVREQISEQGAPGDLRP